MQIRNTLPADAPTVMGLYKQARAYMAQEGNPDQWPEWYPPEELLSREIMQGQSFVCMDKDEIVGAFSLIGGNEPDYSVIYDGAWLNDAPYATVHRLCVARHQAGVGKFCLDWCLGRAGNLRVDTHRDNHPMQALLKKCGFTYCGRIKLDYGAERIAFQKIQRGF